MKRNTSANSRFAKAGVSCFFENPNFVHLMKLRAENPRLRKAATANNHSLVSENKQL
jgi:hypothetical protein